MIRNADLIALFLPLNSAGMETNQLHVITVLPLRFSYSNRDLVDLGVAHHNVTSNPSLHIGICKEFLTRGFAWRTVRNSSDKRDGCINLTGSQKPIQIVSFHEDTVSES